MTRFSHNFFKSNEILFVGIEDKYRIFVSMVYQALTNKGYQLIAMSTKPCEGFGMKIYRDLAELPVVPKTAYLITDLEDTYKLIDPLKAKGVTQILFHSKNVADSAVLAKCDSLGIETSVACPLLVFGGGIHRFHGFLASYKK